MGLLARFFGTGRHDRSHLADLVEAYRGEAEHAVHLRQHAERARYPHVAATLRRLADAEDRHAGWLRDRINGLGGGIPPIAPNPLTGDNQWRRAEAVREAAQRKRRRLVDHITHWDPEEPETVDLLRRIDDEDRRAMASYEDLVMRSDPHALD